MGRSGRGERTARTGFEEDVLPAWRYGSESADHLVQPRSYAAEGIMVEAEEASSEIKCEISMSDLSKSLGPDWTHLVISPGLIVPSDSMLSHLSH